MSGGGGGQTDGVSEELGRTFYPAAWIPPTSGLLSPWLQEALQLAETWAAGREQAEEVAGLHPGGDTSVARIPWGAQLFRRLPRDWLSFAQPSWG